MSLTSHITELRRKHQVLSDAVEKAIRNPAGDDLRVADLKKQKLRLKDEISRLEQVTA